MRYKSMEIAKSLRLPADDAAWLAAVAEHHRRPESVVLRLALRRLREEAGDNGLRLALPAA